MSSTDAEVVIQRIVLQQPMLSGSKEYPVSIIYKNQFYSATVALQSQIRAESYPTGERDTFLCLEKIRPEPLRTRRRTTQRYLPNVVHFKLEIEDMNKKVVCSFLGEWPNRFMNQNLVILSLPISQNSSIFINNGMDLTVIISLGPWDQLNNPEVGKEVEIKVDTNVETKFIADVTPIESLKATLDYGVLTDVVIKSQEEQFHCHKVVLAASYEVFRAMFETDMKENQQNVVDLTDIYDALTIRDDIHYLYTKQTPPTITKTANTLLVAADYFQLAALKNLCVVILCKVVAVDIAAEILQLAEKFNANVLKTKAVNFILDNYQTVLDTPGWKSIP